ncbi:MAG: hypothetical protein ACYTGN_06255 [Planctomycetota bacterium]|jgi:hypothetical protein
MRRARPELLLEVAGLGVVDPFRLEVVNRPDAEGHRVVDPGQAGRETTVERAGMSLAGASQALLGLSLAWMERAGLAKAPDPREMLASGEVRMVVRRPEARLLAALLRRHLARLPQPPGWMRDLNRALEEIDVFLRWEDK